MARIFGVKTDKDKSPALHLKKAKYIRRKNTYKYWLIFSIIINAVCIYLLQVHNLLF